jgi:hypothetical protein
VVALLDLTPYVLGSSEGAVLSIAGIVLSIAGIVLSIVGGGVRIR